MIENIQKSNLTIFDSDEVDTLDSFIESNDIFNKNNQDKKECQFEKIDLNKFSHDFNQIKNTKKPSEIGKLYKKTENNSFDILEPKEFLEQIQLLTTKRDATIEKLKSLHSKCSLGIVDLEHKIEFEEFNNEEGQEILNILKKVIIYQRYIKDTLEQYNSISKITQMLSKSFTTTQIEKLDKVEEFQGSRIYKPRVFNIVERKNFEKSKLSISTIESELDKLIESTNIKYKKV